MHSQEVEQTSQKNTNSKQRKPQLLPLNSLEDLIKTYLKCFKGIGQFPGTYHIILRDDAKPVIYVPTKCLIAMWHMICES